jgi:saccharopine dehydrogenase-like NADP-dependent oxidoreductase
MKNIAILGHGQIGRGLDKILSQPIFFSTLRHLYGQPIVVDAKFTDAPSYGQPIELDLNAISIQDLTNWFQSNSVEYVLNSLPFFLNAKVAQAARNANCSYIDFTEDDQMADQVKAIYQDSGLNCAVKCGLAPGYINYIGQQLVKHIDRCDSLMVSVGALPRLVSYDSAHPELSYNLSWSVDGLVNEYIRPCRVRQGGQIKEIPPLGKVRTVIIDGVEYEAAYTSGGIGSLVEDLDNIDNVSYMTLRYPGHYRYVCSVVQENNNDFEKIKKVFQEKFPYTNDDVIVAYAEATGYDAQGRLVKKSYANKFYGAEELTAIQSTTAGAGVAILELFLEGKLSGIVNHKDVDIYDFFNTKSYKIFYNKTK